MKQFKQPLLTIVIIFATAYILSLIGCAPSGDKSVGAKAPSPDVATSPTTGAGSNVKETLLVKIDPSKMRECKDGEFKNLQSWGSALSASDAAIQAMGKSQSWKKKDEVIKLAQKTIVQCDQLQAYHLQNPCKKVVDQTVVNPAGTVKPYDAFRIHERCDVTNRYLTLFNSRPDKSVIPSAPVQPPVVNVHPTPVTPVEPPVVIVPGTSTDVEARDMHECNEAEFFKIKPWRSALDLANKSIAKLGPQSSWKYDPNAIDFSKSATQLCEALIPYHQAQPCKRFVKDDDTRTTTTKIYSGESLRQQCASARTYQYEFAQQGSSLIVPNARLYLDTSIVSGRPINLGYSSDIRYNQCIFSNGSEVPVTYNSEKVLITEARVNTIRGVDGEQMFVMVTADKIKIECYGLEYPSAKTSKNEVVRLLNKKQTPIQLSYELN